MTNYVVQWSVIMLEGRRIVGSKTSYPVSNHKHSNRVTGLWIEICLSINSFS